MEGKGRDGGGGGKIGREGGRKGERETALPMIFRDYILRGF